MRQRLDSRGFTLLELLLVLSISALLASLVVPRVARVRDGVVAAERLRSFAAELEAWRLHCLSNGESARLIVPADERSAWRVETWTNVSNDPRDFRDQLSTRSNAQLREWRPRGIFAAADAVDTLFLASDARACSVRVSARPNGVVEVVAYDPNQRRILWRGER